MTARTLLFVRDQRGAAATEFALLTPLLILLIFGMIDVGAYAWQMNMTQKATQFGARVAAVTNPVASGLAGLNFVGTTVDGVALAQGDTIPDNAIPTIVCDKTACTPATYGYGADSFKRIVARMRGIDPRIPVDGTGVTVEYRGSGLGYAGDPAAMQISPLATVRVKDMTYKPWMGLLLGGGIKLPQTSYTLTMEDGTDVNSN